MINFKALNKKLIKNSNYINWINDKKINRFLEVRFHKQSLNDLYKYVENSNNSKTEFLFGIFSNEEHIGNIKVYNINDMHKFAEISIVIGESRFHNKGIALKAISFIKNFAKKNIQLRKLITSSYDSNEASIKLFLKSDFTKIGEFKNHHYDGDKLVNTVYFEYFL